MTGEPASRSSRVGVARRTDMGQQVQRLGAYAVVVRGDRILLTRLAERVTKHELWTLPGGGVDHGGRLAAVGRRARRVAADGRAGDGGDRGTPTAEATAGRGLRLCREGRRAATHPELRPRAAAGRVDVAR